METAVTMDLEKSLLSHDKNIDIKILYEGRPCLLALANVFLCGLVLLVVSGFLMFYPVEKLTPAENAPQLCLIAGIVLTAIVILYILKKIVELKLVSYTVTTDRIEWERGFIRRKIDNVDLFRIIDLRLHRSLFEILLGIGTVTIFTTDKTEPEFHFRNIRKPRALYDILKRASLDSDRRRSVVHFE